MGWLSDLAGWIQTTLDNVASIERGLREIEGEIERGEFVWTRALEDVHLNIEARLTALVGDAGKRLHTGRSRNDQVATDLRLYLRDNVRLIVSRLSELETALIDQAAACDDLPAPGLTHLQHAQPVLFGHQLLAHVQAFARDVGRLRDWDKRAAVSPSAGSLIARSFRRPSSRSAGAPLRRRPRGAAARGRPWTGGRRRC